MLEAGVTPRTADPKWIHPKFAAITAGIIGIIVYGSLFPFRFHGPVSVAAAFHALLASWRILPIRGDLISNILLYVPLGLFAVRALRGFPAFVRVALVVLTGLALSTSIELLQFYDAGRLTNMADVLSNTTGTLAGAIAGAAFRRDLRLPLIGSVIMPPFVALLLACWLGYRLFPYLPVFNLHKHWAGPLRFPLLDVSREAVVWLVIAVLLEAVAGVARSRWLIVLLAPAVVLMRFLIAEIVVTPAEMAGAVLGPVVWALLSRIRARAAVVAALFAGLIVVQGLEPFKFSGTARLFGWTPFRSFLQGPRETGVRMFFEKIFTYGALIWLLARAGCSLRTAALVGGALVLCLRLTQVYLPGRSAEITDVIMLLIVAVIMKLMGAGPSQPRLQPD